MNILGQVAGGLLCTKARGKYLSGIEREQIEFLTVPANVPREDWALPSPLHSAAD